jgi:hypothetical protein
MHARKGKRTKLLGEKGDGFGWLSVIMPILKYQTVDFSKFLNKRRQVVETLEAAHKGQSDQNKLVSKLSKTINKKEK